MSSTQYPKRLIEVDLPIRAISAHARREKTLRHGHISTLHLWWARRPLAACRAVVCASLWPDPVDQLCPQQFRDAAARILCEFAGNVRTNKALAELSAAHWTMWNATTAATLRASDPAAWVEMRHALLAFIADFANWDASTFPAFVETARALTEAAHTSLTVGRGTHPTLVDPFAGGGAIPLEGLRVGAETFASDLNPVAVLLNRVTLDYVPKYGTRLVEAVRKWGGLIGSETHKQLASYYPTDPDGAQPIIYLWARTVKCEGPACGVEIPLLRSLWIVKRRKKLIALRLHPDKQRSIRVEIVEGAKPAEVGRGTSNGGAATCPLCGYTTPVESVRAQLGARRGGAQDPRLVTVIARSAKGRIYRAPTDRDLKAADSAIAALSRLPKIVPGGLTPMPDGEINHLRGFFNIVLYGNTVWGDLFTPRQGLALSTLSSLVRELPDAEIAPGEPQFAEAIKSCLALIVNRVAVRCTANCIWDGTCECIMQVFNQGQALPARWEFAEMCPTLDEGSGWSTSIEYATKVLEHLATLPRSATVQLANATQHPLPDDSSDLVVTDPPYYAAIPYADLSDFFFSWLKRSLAGYHADLLGTSLVPKGGELVSLAHRAAMYREKNNAWFEAQMGFACLEARRICIPEGLGVWVFANKETAAWEAMLGALIGAGWVVTASWPIDTESGSRLRAKDSAALASSVHLVCRPRESADGTLREDNIGSWRAVLGELPGRIHEWMPRLDHEGVVGADAIFACLGPALEIFSRHSRVEKASGETVTLREYLEHVWAAVAREALSMIFEGADASGLEEDGRVTAMWLWTFGSGTKAASNEDDGEDVPADDEEGRGAKAKPLAGFVLEFDAARKIAQGLGAHLEKLTDVIEVKGDKARLLAVAERAKSLFSKQANSADEASSSASAKAKVKSSKKQLGLFGEIEAAEKEGLLGKGGIPKVGETTLDRVHQSMILFGAGRSEALKRFIVEEGVGKDARFWKLAQSLSALYPSGSDEKRWVDGVLARKKSLGF